MGIWVNKPRKSKMAWVLRHSLDCSKAPFVKKSIDLESDYVDFSNIIRASGNTTIQQVIDFVTVQPSLYSCCT